jgi:hypothetical protein
MAEIDQCIVEQAEEQLLASCASRDYAATLFRG